MNASRLGPASVVVLAGAMLAGCGAAVAGHATSRLAVQSATTPDQSGGTASPAWSPAPASTGEVVYPGTGVRYHLSNEQAPVSAAQARGVAESAPYASLLTGTPLSQLARSTDDDFPPSGGTPAHHDENLLAWVLTYRNTSPAPGGGQRASNMATTNDCDFVVVVNATDGSLVTGFQSCPGQMSVTSTS